MLQIVNPSSCECALGLFSDVVGRDCVAVVAKATFRIPSDQRRATELNAEQLPILFEEEFFGDANNSSVRYPADIVLGKARTDIILIGQAYAPRKIPVTEMYVSMRVGPVQRTLRIVGDRQWAKKSGGFGYAATPASPFTAMPIIYERAFGGRDETHDDSSKHSFHASNPVGQGFRLNPSAVDGALLPNLEDAAQPITDWRDRPPGAGFGAIASSWEPRQRYAGTYDEQWKERKFPFLPDDFDIRFFNAAPLPQQVGGFLRGGELVELFGLSSTREVLRFNLPMVNIRFAFRFEDCLVEKEARLWTVALEPDRDRLYLAWGASQPVGKQPSRLWSVHVSANGDLDIRTQDKR